jgi:nucleotide-binding universal stress UspA family protein
MLLFRSSLMILSFMLFPVIIGCTQTQFVVLREVPESPSFVVIPANNYLNQVAFANEVEAAIISAGIKVVMFSQATKGVTKEVAVEEGILAVEGTQAAHKSGEGKLIERYVEFFEEIKADYIVLTYAGSRQIRIIKRQTSEILAVLEVPRFLIRDPELRQKRRQHFYNLLAKMGIPVVYPHKQGGATSRPTRNSR